MSILDVDSLDKARNAICAEAFYQRWRAILGKLAKKLAYLCTVEDFNEFNIDNFKYAERLTYVLQDAMADQLFIDRLAYSKMNYDSEHMKSLDYHAVRVDEESEPTLLDTINIRDYNTLCKSCENVCENVCNIVELIDKMLHEQLVLGAWISQDRTIVLYKKNILKAANSTDPSDKKVTYLLVSTIVHELMHCYFDIPGKKHPYLPFVEESLCEAGMLNFLASIKDYGPTFSNGYEYCKEYVKCKEVGLKNYALGAYMHEGYMNSTSLLYGLNLPEMYHKLWAKSTDTKSTEIKLRNNEIQLGQKIFIDKWPNEALVEISKLLLDAYFSSVN